jgi:uncharacterized protein
MSSDAGDFLRNWFGRLAESGWTAEVFLAALADDLVWTATGTSPVSGVFHGKEEYVDKVYRPLDERLVTWPKPVVERIVAEGEWGVVQFGSRGGPGKNGTDYNMRYCWAMRVNDGLVREVVGYYDTAKVAELFS